MQKTTIHLLRMSETPIELEPRLSVQPSSQPESGRGLQPPPLFQLPLPTQDPSDTHQQMQLQLEPQLSESNPEHQQQAKPVWINRRRLIRLILGFSLCSAILGLVYYMHYNHQNSNIQAGKGRPPEKHNTITHTVTPCLSPACQWASARLSISADPFTQPCDYFLFTCGSDILSPDNGGRQRGQGIPGHPQNQKEKAVWTERRGQSKEREDRGLRKEKIPDRKTVLLQYLREILESNTRPGSTAVQKAKGFYHSCLDTKSIQTAGAEPFLALIQKLGGWAVSGQWNRTDFNSTLRLLMRDYATFPFFNLYVGKDPNEIAHGTTRRYIQIDQPDLLIPIEWNSKTLKSQAKTRTLRPFLASCERYLALLGAPPSSSMIHVGTFISLSSELAVAAAPLDFRLSKGQLYQRMTIRELQKQAPAIDWLGCLQAAFHPLPLIEDDHVLLHNLPYIVQMSRIVGKWLNKHEPSSSGPVHTYMVLSLLHKLMPALDSRFSETAKNLSMALGDAEEGADRWKHCVLETERGFDLVLTHLLSKRTAHREIFIVQQAEEIIQNIFTSFKSKLHELKWTDQKSLQFVMKKIQSLIPRLWTTKEISSEAELDLLFSKVTVGTTSFFSNYVQSLSLWQKRRSQLLTEKAEAADILSVTPFLLGDELLFPMGMFIPPLFHPTYPRAMNYGVMGFIIAKDILHLILPDVYSHSEMVHAVGECVWAHYLTVTEKAGRGGEFSLSAAQQQELWVQYSALQIALQAYHQSLKNHPNDTSISGLSHTRLFLTSFSQVNCDSDPYSKCMPLEPSFLITVICAKSDLCPTSLQCPNKTQQHSLETC
ncbi:kell blood group glycoprotein isoform X2 [Anarrhichthys ocellatus]|uniref:kell blood group glycoprotein isoform X2 n=1 Tax=Anarrhichthys ocellatus TaxID=433405 RepID=UPI0012EE7658|nr:kell blood group glycoprotein-like isoform X2 [Anarrhichthys ocellatus]